MNSFKEVMAQDISAVFLNGNEFADTFNIDGKDMLAVLDTDLIHERNKRSYAEFAEGVNQGQITLFVERIGFERVPVKDQQLSICSYSNDGRLNPVRRYTVDEVNDDCGVLELTLTVNTNRGATL